MGNLRKLYNLARLYRNAWQPKEELERQQCFFLRRMIDFARTNIPFYKKRYKSLGLDRYPISSIQDLQRLPIITKQNIQSVSEEFLNPNIDIKDCLEMHTSGSTGMPLRIFCNSRDDDYSKVNNLRSFIELGYKPWHRFIHISDPEWVERRYYKSKKPWFQKFDIFNPIDIDMRESADILLDKILTYGCDILYGYPSSIFLVAKAIQRRNCKGIKPKLVVTNGELLPDEMRQFINNIFSTELVDFYTTEEFKRIAWECHEHNGYHVDINNVVLEFIQAGRAAKSGERGEIIITGLHNFTMPLIRYRQGDVGIPTEKMCSCGRGLPLMEMLEGRCDNFVVNSKGELFSPLIFWSILRHRNDINRYKIIQRSNNLIVFQYVPSSKFNHDTTIEIQNAFWTVLGRDMQIEFESLKDITYDKRGAVYSDLILNIYS